MNEDKDERTDDGEDESLPFDVERERLPVWVHASSALVILVGVLVATRLVHMLVFLPFLVASSIGRRFASIAMRVEVKAGGLDLGGLEIPRSEIVDVWVDDDEVEPRVIVAFGEDVELAVLHFQNREQARRFGSELAAKDTAEENQRRALVAGHKPGPVDMLASLRFVAIAAAFFGTGSSYGLLVLVFFALGARNIARTKQLIARADGFEVRTAFGAQVYPYTDVESVDVDAGVISLKGGRELSVPRSALRDPMLASAAWLERARVRVLGRIRQSARLAR